MSSEVDCRFVLKLNSTIERCNFVINNTDCQDASGYFNYVELLYCHFPESPIAGIGLFALWLAFLFVGLGVSADDYFCPNLDTMAKTLRLSQNIAGITIMALGNGAPDIFSSFASVSQARPELLLGELFGAGVFVSTFVAGSICLVRPFKLMERPFLRDVVFYLAAGFWAFFIFYRGQIHFSDSVGFLCLYCVYILVVIVGRYINQQVRQQRNSDERLIPEENEDPISVDGENPSLITSNTPLDSVPDSPFPPAEQESIVETIHLETAAMVGNFKSLALSLLPIEWQRGSSSSCYQYAWGLLKLPYTLLFSLTIPIAPYEDDNHWSQVLHLIHCLLGPQLVLFASGWQFTQIYYSADDKFRAWEVTLVGSLILCLFYLCASSPSKPPKWRPLLSFFGFGISVVWIYGIANEVVAILKVFGVALGFSDAILGLTLLAWGNSLSDLISNLAVARQNSPRMGFSACFGGPLFNLLLGIGLPLSYLFLKTDRRILIVKFNPMVTVLSISLGGSLIFSLIYLPLAKFQASRLYGALLVFLYVLFLIFVVLAEIHLRNISR